MESYINIRFKTNSKVTNKKQLTNMHYMKCQSNTAKEARNERRTLKRVGFTKQHYMQFFRLLWYNRKGMLTHTSIEMGDIDKHVIEAIGNQSRIGWRNMRQDFISKQWGSRHNNSMKE